MCSLIAITIATTIASAAMSAYSSVEQGKQAKANAKYADKLAQRDANILEKRAKDAEKRGFVEEERVRRKNAGQEGKNTSLLAASGLSLDSGSLLQFFEDGAESAELDAQTVRYSAKMDSWNLRNQGTDAQLQGAFALHKGKREKQASLMNAGQSILGAIKQTASIVGNASA